jgi:hypothetical protein
MNTETRATSHEDRPTWHGYRSLGELMRSELWERMSVPNRVRAETWFWRVGRAA